METYTAINNSGVEYKRPARTINELPHHLRDESMLKMRDVIEDVIGEKLHTAELSYGIRLWDHFLIPNSQVRTHPQSKLLLTRCGDLPLSLINQ